MQTSSDHTKIQNKKQKKSTRQPVRLIHEKHKKKKDNTRRNRIQPRDDGFNPKRALLVPSLPIHSEQMESQI